MSTLRIHDLSYRHPDRETQFQHISLSIECDQKAALIGDNGSGKSTLLRLIAGFLPPSSGEIALEGIPYYIPQHFGDFGEMTLAGALGVETKLNALRAILAGNASEEAYEQLGEDWEIEERIRAALTPWGLADYSLGNPMASLSGGEKMRLLLAGIALHDPDVVLLDEPTNHLDLRAREQLYKWLRQSRAAVLFVSHDRTLLELADSTYELARGTLQVYGGNYALYREQWQAQSQALAGQLHEKQKALRAAKEKARQATERKARLDNRGERKQTEAGIPRILMKTLRNTAEASASRLQGAHAEKIEAISGQLHDLRDRFGERRELKVKLGDAGLHAGKRLIEARAINFGYTETMLWPEPLTFDIFSGERIAIGGSNGSGKTTLLKLILGQLAPSCGKLLRAPFSTLYIDQDYSLLDNGRSVYEEVARHNTRHLPESALKTELHRFLLPEATWERPCGTLSGGEKMKLIFCCLLVGDTSPEVLVLDEPTNNLDIRSLEIVASALKGYRGTLLVISHDRYFLQEIGIGREIDVGL